MKIWREEIADKLGENGKGKDGGSTLKVYQMKGLKVCEMKGTLALGIAFITNLYSIQLAQGVSLC